MSNKKDDQVELDTSDDGAVDMKGVQEPVNTRTEESLAGERQEREKEKANAKPAEKGGWIVITDMKCDGKRYKRGDVYEGKMYAGIEKSLMSKAEWANR